MQRTLILLALPAAMLAAQAPPAPPDQIHLAWTRDPSTTATVVWRTVDPDVPSTVEYRRQGENRWRRAGGGPRPSGTEGRLHEVLLQGLEPGSRYEYRVAGPQGSWSHAYSFLTAPRPGGSFEAVFVADTGLDGRLDGLSTPAPARLLTQWRNATPR